MVEPYDAYENVSVEKVIEEQDCVPDEYRYERAWLGFRNLGVIVKPGIRIVNLESNWGLFRLNFSLFDEEKYPYENYKDREYDEFKNELSRDMADFHTSEYELWVPPLDQIEFSPDIIKQNYNKSYWVLASINPPDLLDCQPIYKTVNATEERRVTKYKKIPVIKDVKKKVSLFTYMSKHILYLLLVIIFGIIIIIIKRNKFRDTS